MKLRLSPFLPLILLVFALIILPAGDAAAYCHDSDGGIDYDQKGCADGYCDFCEDSNWLREYYCSGGNVDSHQYRCSNGCSDGECITGSGPGYLNIYRCSGDWRQREYQYADGHTEWKNWEYCQYGCQNGWCKLESSTSPTVEVTASRTVVDVGETFYVRVGARTEDPQGLDYLKYCYPDDYCYTYDCKGYKTCGYSKSQSYDSPGSYTFRGYAYGENGLSASNNGASVTVTVGGGCTPSYLNNYQCSGDWKQREYQYSDCSTTWKNYQYCSQGCQNGQCITGCTAGYLNNYRCSGDWKQREYQYSDCSTKWIDYQRCDYGCSGGQCLQAPAKARITSFYCDDYSLGEGDKTTCAVRVENAGRVDKAKLYVNGDGLVSVYPNGVPSYETFDFVVESIETDHFSVAVHSFYGKDDSDSWIVRETNNELKLEVRDSPSGEYDSRTVTFTLIAQECSSGYLNNYRCSGEWRQREYQHSDCSTSWINYEYCDYGCSNGQCVTGCSIGYLDNYQCSGDWRQREYQHSDCSTSWINYEYCDYGCSNNVCLSGCTPGYLDEYQCSGDDLQRKYQKADCGIEWRTVEACQYGCSNGQCNPAPEIACSIDVFGLDVVENGADDIIRVKVKNTGDVDQFISYTLYVNDNDVAAGSFELNQSDTHVLENSYTFSPGSYNIRIEAASDCGATDKESMVHRVLEPYTCSNPNGYEGQRRCDLSGRRYLVCRNGNWESVAENSGDYCYYCSHCGDGLLNCGETAETCPEDYAYCGYVSGCPPHGCQPKYLDQYQCRGSWVQRLYRYSNCETEWEDWEYCEYGCSGGECIECQPKYLDQYRCKDSWVQRLYRYSSCDIEWQGWEYCEYGCSGGSCRVPCGVSITGYDYNDKVRVGESGFFTLTVKNTGQGEERIELELFIDGVKKRSFAKNLFAGEDYTETFEYALSKGSHRLTVFANADCGKVDSISVDTLVYEREFEIIVPPEQPETGAVEETDVVFKPLYLDIELGESEVLYADVKTKSPQMFRFDVRGLEDGWVSYTREKFVENREKVFIYITPKKPGNFKFFVSARAEDEKLEWNAVINAYAAVPKQYRFGIPFCDGSGVCGSKLILWGAVLILIVILFLIVITAVLRLKK
jgi:hypothetical protein